MIPAYIRIWIIFSPFVYLTYHGWASKNLLDTRASDRLAFLFWISSSIILVIREIYFAECK